MRSAGPLSALPPTMGDTATVRSRARSSRSRTPATASSGPIETIGFEGAITNRSASSSTCGGRRGQAGVVGAGEAHAGDRHLVTPGHEVLLEVDLSLAGDHQSGLQRIVGDGEEPDPDPVGGRELGRHLGQRGALTQAVAAVEVGGQIPVAQAEPGGAGPRAR